MLRLLQVADGGDRVSPGGSLPALWMRIYSMILTVKPVALPSFLYQTV